MFGPAFGQVHFFVCARLPTPESCSRIRGSAIFRPPDGLEPKRWDTC